MVMLYIFDQVNTNKGLTLNNIHLYQHLSIQYLMANALNEYPSNNKMSSGNNTQEMRSRTNTVSWKSNIQHKKLKN